MKTQSKQTDPAAAILIRDLRAARRDLTAAYQLFNQTLDPELIEFSVYQISAGMARCDYLIRAIKGAEAGEGSPWA